MVVGVMILPAAAARFWATEITGLIGAAVVIAVLSSAAGLLVSYHWSLPSGPAIILAIGIIYLGSLGFGRVGSLLVTYLPRRHLEA
jgi:zinc/manganese transport system permease protein